MADLTLKLKKGNYVLWVYNSYYTLPDSTSYRYIVRLLSQIENVNFQKKGVDSDEIILRRLTNSQLGNDVLKQYGWTDNRLLNFRFASQAKTNKYYNFDFSKVI